MCRKFIIFFISLLMIFSGSSICGYCENYVENDGVCVAENTDYRLFFNYDDTSVSVQNKSTGYTWYSSPSEFSEDTNSLIIQELKSSSVLTYGIGRTSKTIRSDEDKCKITVSDISNGIRVTYDYYTVGIKYPVEYTLEDNYLKAGLKISDIEETGENIALRVSILGSFGAGSSEETGYFVIPDGCGALINFNNGKENTDSYSQRIYGDDITAVSETKSATTEQVYLPCYGIVKKNNAVLTVAVKGDSNAMLNASVSGQSKSEYNLCNFSFILRDSDTFYMAGDSGTKLTVFESGDIESDDIEIRYYFISKKNVSYTDVAEKYREYLVENGLNSKVKSDYAPLYIDLYGGTEKEISVLGIPVMSKKSVTSYSQAKKILKNFTQNEIELVVSYNNWTDLSISNEIDKKAKISSTLGGKSDFKSLLNYINSNDIKFYPTTDNILNYNGDTTVRISGSYSKIVSYNLAYGVRDSLKSVMSLLPPENFKKIYSEVAENYVLRNLDGISLGDMTKFLYGDYGKNKISRYDTMKLLKESYEILNQELEILADSANAYVLPYVENIKNLPLTSSRFDVFDEDVPFYQIVLHGIVSYSTTPINADSDIETLLLKAVATGSNLHFDMIYEDTSLLQSTDLNGYYYAKYSDWSDTAISSYKLVADVLKSVSDCTITGYRTNGDIVITTYSNGIIIKTDFKNKTIEYNGNTIFLAF